MLGEGLWWEAQFHSPLIMPAGNWKANGSKESITQLVADLNAGQWRAGGLANRALGLRAGLRPARAHARWG